MPGKFHGEQQEGILRWLVENWIPHGPPVAILEGFPGCGKSQLAREVANQVERAVGPVEPPEESEDRARELFLELAVILEQHSLPELAHAFDVGRGARFDKALLQTLRSNRILIVVDEFQRLFPKEDTTPAQSWAKLVEQLSNSPNPAGRLLLVSNRLIKNDRWCENCRIKEVQGLIDAEAEAY